MQMKKYYDLFNLIYFNVKNKINNLLTKVFGADKKPERSPRTSKENR